MALKILISSPLEAGQSVLDAHRLPSHLDAALEYTARRLARKSLSIDLVVIRREYQLPQTKSTGQPEDIIKDEEKQTQEPRPRATTLDVPCVPRSSINAHTTLPSKPLPSLPSPPAPAPTSRFAKTIKGLVRSNSVPSITPSSPTTTEPTETKRPDTKSKWSFSLRSRSGTTSGTSSPPSPTLSPFSISSPIFSSALGDFLPPPSTPSTSATPATPASPSSSYAYNQTSTATTTTHTHKTSKSRSSSLSLLSPASFGIRLVHADGLLPAHKRVLDSILVKAAQRFRLPPNWLPAPVSASDLGLPAALVRHSVEQNQILFQSASLVLRSPDHLYTFKAALCSYAHTGDRYRLEDAVDELRRYILLLLGGTTTNSRRLCKRELLRRYPELCCFSDAHIVDVNRMYSRAYGGSEYETGIAADGLSLSPPMPMPLHKNIAEADEEQSTPTATAVNDSALIALTRGTRVAIKNICNRNLAVDAGVKPVLGKPRRQRPAGMVFAFARPTAGDELSTSVLSPSAFSVSSMLSPSVLSTSSVLSPSVLSTSSALSTPSSVPSSVPSLSLSMCSSVDDVMEHMRTMVQAHRHATDATDSTDRTDSACDSAWPLTPDSDDDLDEELMSLPLTKLRPAPRLPALKLQTTFQDDNDSNTNKNDDELTARPASCVRRAFISGASLGNSIGAVLASPLSGPGDDSVSVGPVPPHTYDDISPITRSEWGFLKDDLLGRQVNVTSFN